MKTPKTVASFELEATCSSITEREWDKLMEGATKANVLTVENLIRTHHTTDKWFVGKLNPYRKDCFKTKTHIIYTHSGIEYFFRYAV
jgi:hypothetical protein